MKDYFEKQERKKEKYELQKLKSTEYLLKWLENENRSRSINMMLPLTIDDLLKARKPELRIYGIRIRTLIIWMLVLYIIALKLSNGGIT